jgi:hypothetical protein
MKKCSGISVLCFLACLAQAKSELKFTPVNVDMMGKSVRLDFRNVQNKNVFYGGIGYIINPPSRATFYGAVFVNKAYARNFFEHINITAGYERSIKFKNGDVRVYPFFEITLSKTGIKTENYWPPDQKTPVVPITVDNYIFKNTSVLWISNHTGIGAEIALLPKLGLCTQIGINPSRIVVSEDVVVNGREQTNKYKYLEGIIYPYYSIGVCYKL